MTRRARAAPRTADLRFTHRTISDDKVVVKHYISCRPLAPCSWYLTHGIVRSKISGEPPLVTIAVPRVVNAPTSAYLDVGDEVHRTEEMVGWMQQCDGATDLGGDLLLQKRVSF